MNVNRLAFIDESYCKTGMCREHAWSQRGSRARGERPFRSWKTVSLIGAIRLGERPRLMTHRGTVDGVVFLRYVKQYLNDQHALRSHVFTASSGGAIVRKPYVG